MSRGNKRLNIPHPCTGCDILDRHNDRGPGDLHGCRSNETHFLIPSYAKNDHIARSGVGNISATDFYERPLHSPACKMVLNIRRYSLRAARPYHTTFDHDLL